MGSANPTHYRQPGWVTQHVFNRAATGLIHMGMSVWGSHVLEVEGRTSGQPGRAPVNLLALDGEQYLVSARLEPGRSSNRPERSSRPTVPMV
jgi:hypothetical protein